jgi:hypothetical protein
MKQEMRIEERHPEWVLDRGAPVMACHEESVAWKEEIEFWTDEMRFLERLILRRKQVHAVNRKISTLLDHLVHMEKLIVHDLYKLIDRHDSRLMKADEVFTDESVAAYREDHYRIRSRFHEVKRDYRELKRKIYEIEKGE